MKKKIKNFILVADSFGPMPIWSLQDAVKEIGDSYMIYLPLIMEKKDWPKWMKKLYEVEQYMKKLSKDMHMVDAYIDAEIEYSTNLKKYLGLDEKPIEKIKFIIEMKITNIEIMGYYPEGGV